MPRTSPEPLKPPQAAASHNAMTSLAIRPRPLLAVGLFAALVGCRHSPPPPSVWVPVSAQTAPPPLLLAEVAITNSAALDGLLEGLSLLGGDDELPTILQEAASRMGPDDLERNAGARLLVCHAVYRLVRAPNFADRFPAIRAMVDALHAAAPDAPETRFSRAYLRWVLLADGQGGLAWNGLDPAIVRDLHRDLQVLADQHPEFDGPGAFDHRRIRIELAAVAALLATAPATDALDFGALPDAATPVDAPDPLTPAVLPAAATGSG